MFPVIVAVHVAQCRLIKIVSPRLHFLHLSVSCHFFKYLSIIKEHRAYVITGSCCISSQILWDFPPDSQNYQKRGELQNFPYGSIGG